MKNGNIHENLQRNNVARQFEGFCISYFAALNEKTFLRKKKGSLMYIIGNQLLKSLGRLFCYRACSLKHAVFISYIPQTKQSVTLSPRPSNSLFFFPFTYISTSPSPLAIVVCLPLLGNIFNEQHWNLVNVVFMVAKLGNICFERNICVREAKMFLTSGKNIFLFPSSKIGFRNMFLARLNCETFAFATMFPQRCNVS